MMKETIILSVGGSLIVPEDLDTKFLKQFKELILTYIKKGYKFVIITGGGMTARKYQAAAKEVGKLSHNDLDWIGIHSTRLNAHLIGTMFRGQAHPNIIKDPSKKIISNKNILIAAGWKPGCSTDYDAVLIAKNLKAKKIINLTNIDYVYDKDPRTNPDAKKLEKISWKDFRKIVGNKWSPGLNAPFDPVASKECEKQKIKVQILNGKNMQNLENAILGKDFIGTTIN
jgi:uridylate kinase